MLSQSETNLDFYHDCQYLHNTEFLSLPNIMQTYQILQPKYPITASFHNRKRLCILSFNIYYLNSLLFVICEEYFYSIALDFLLKMGQKITEQGAIVNKQQDYTNRHINNINRSTMQEEYNQNKTLDILCIGEIQAGKTFFLKQYTQDEGKQSLCAPYDLYAKKVKNTQIYFHQLSEEEDLYLEKEYNGIIFFVDLVNNWQVAEKILKWMELQSKYTGVNIFKIPLRVIITRTKTHKNEQKWKKMLQKQLLTVVDMDQIMYFEDLGEVQKFLQLFYNEIIGGHSAGIRPSNQNYVRLYGLNYVMKLFAMNVKLTFFRCLQLYDLHVRNKLQSVFNINNSKIN